MSWVATIILGIAGLLAPAISLPSEVESQLTAMVVGQPNDKTVTKPAIYEALPQPRQTSNAPLSLTAKSAFAIDVTTGQPLYALKPDEKRPIASFTKVDSALVLLERHSLSEVVTIPTLPTYKPEEAVMGLKAGETFTVGSLLAAMLVPSANDAADAMAIIDSGSKQAFVEKMNALPPRWGIADTHFSNPSGLQDTDNYASARSLARLGMLLLANPTAKQLVATAGTTITDQSGQSFQLASTNPLLQNGAFTGIKTGYTPAAGECFMGLATIKGHQVITVVLGSTDRFGESSRLASWIGENYTWQ